ncbi:MULTISPECIES: trypsin-like serine peptidase [unclassified Paracoccus (in: a-proteobacteria)]|uniref:trypsin-like serine peptidase n=1 Tax=unclassified Paracoccus (in: a-proteobacteria) TaxID=2688777 RepID=UPI0012B26E2B|nr:MULTISPECIES: trypsin-like serine protease [unclassified Paracoccus (in: a-proteobacteria)]UXU76518.1 trypsin-like serine protease [Paracoccus sp. SMMA_5]UXU82415.1 trypsin-like serine protease [Paracoccus sp. SMMA_5_TC]
MALFSVSNKPFPPPSPAATEADPATPPAAPEAGVAAAPTGKVSDNPVPVQGKGPPLPGTRQRNPLTGFETIIGDTDERQPVADASTDPWRRICQLDLIGSRGTFKGTGFLIGPATVLTAGHCLHYPPFFAGWADHVLVAAGRGGGNFPFGQIRAEYFSTLNLWIEGQAADYDIAAIHLQEPLGQRTGWFPLQVRDDADLIGRLVNISGYPTDKDLARTQYHHANRIMAVTRRRLFYDVDTVSGQSGAPVWVQDDGQDAPVCVGIHAYGVPGTPIDLHITANSAPRLDDEVMALITAWVAEDCARLGLPAP